MATPYTRNERCYKQAKKVPNNQLLWPTVCHDAHGELAPYAKPQPKKLPRACMAAVRNPRLQATAKPRPRLQTTAKASAGTPWQQAAENK
jgi:hypothetical protein